jgi:hypothetical protein
MSSIAFLSWGGGHHPSVQVAARGAQQELQRVGELLRPVAVHHREVDRRDALAPEDREAVQVAERGRPLKAPAGVAQGLRRDVQPGADGGAGVPQQVGLHPVQLRAELRQVPVLGQGLPGEGQRRELVRGIAEVLPDGLPDLGLGGLVAQLLQLVEQRVELPAGLRLRHLVDVRLREVGRLALERLLGAGLPLRQRFLDLLARREADFLRRGGDRRGRVPHLDLLALEKAGLPLRLRQGHVDPLLGGECLNLCA